MAADNDNNTQLNDAQQSPEEVQPWDTDLPVDSDADATNADVAKGFNKKKIAGLAIVVGLVILAGIVVFSLSKKPIDTTSTQPPTVAQTPPDIPAEPGKKPSAATPTPEQQKPASQNPNQPVTGDLARPADQDWVKGVEKPLPVPNNLQGTPGQPGSNTPQVQVVKEPTGSSKTAPANSTQAAMNRLWESGAAAKHRGDYAAARKDWQRILELDPGHPGIQEAINKLPK